MLTAENIYKSERYQTKFSAAQLEFSQIYRRSTQESNMPFHFEGSYSKTEKRMLGTQIAMVLSPDLINLSQCAHRGVSATLSLHLKQSPDMSQRDEAFEYLQKKHLIGNFFDTDEGAFLVVHGNNTWMAQKNGLDCKKMPGHPFELEHSELPYLEESQFEDVDLACPKRTKHLACNITHAEETVINSVQDISKIASLSRSAKTILTSTWVSCSNCVHLITKNRVVFGSQIDVFSVYGAAHDKQDEEMARHIKSELHDGEVGKFSGPFVSLPKEVNYGWWPSSKSSLEVLGNHLSAARGVDGEASLLRYALSLL